MAFIGLREREAWSMRKLNDETLGNSEQLALHNWLP